MVKFPIVVIIPTRYHIYMLEKLIPSLTDATKIYVYDNGLLPEQLEKLKSYAQLKIINAREKTIYEMWNSGWARAQTEFTNNVHIAILNDDIYFYPGTLTILSSFLESDPSIAAISPDYSISLESGISPDIVLEYTQSTYGHGGLAGFAFMLNGALDIPKIDEHFLWWYGDDDLVKNIEASGYKVAKAKGLPIVHNQGMSSRMDNTIKDKIDLDRYYFNLKYGENRC